MRKLKLEELGRMDEASFQKAEKLPVILILDNLRSALNIGSVFRSADAFRVEKIYICGISAQPPHKEINKTAIGATRSVQWEYKKNVLDAVRELKQQEIPVWAIEQTNQSVPLHQWLYNPRQKYAFVFGNEVEGISDEILPALEGAIEIPQYGTKHSLNVSVSVGVVLWHLMDRRLRAASDLS